MIIAQQLQWRFQLKKMFKWDIFKYIWDLRASVDLDYARQTVWSHFMFLNKSPATSVVWKNAVTLFYCEAPEMFCGLRNFTEFSADNDCKLSFWGKLLL